MTKISILRKDRVVLDTKGCLGKITTVGHGIESRRGGEDRSVIGTFDYSSH